MPRCPVSFSITQCTSGCQATRGDEVRRIKKPLAEFQGFFQSIASHTANRLRTERSLVASAAAGEATSGLTGRAPQAGSQLMVSQQAAERCNLWLNSRLSRPPQRLAPQGAGHGSQLAAGAAGGHRRAHRRPERHRRAHKQPAHAQAGSQAGSQLASTSQQLAPQPPRQPSSGRWQRRRASRP